MTEPRPGFRIERDSLGAREIPDSAYYGVQTLRAVENFPISGRPMPRRFVRALGVVKAAAAVANRDLGRLPRHLADAILRAAEEVAEGTRDGDFPIDIFQTGSATSSNMNANEVIANRAIELLGGKKGTKDPVHPNDHVNMSQSSNDVVPTAIHIAAVRAIREETIPGFERLAAALEAKSAAFDDVLKAGRTHLMDATPIRLGQEFSGWATQARKAVARLSAALGELAELPLGGTAVGTGINCPADFPARAIAEIARREGFPFREAENHFEAQAAKDGCLSASGHLRTAAVSLHKIANDIRWLSSGPRCGLAELVLPALQPGSSIMPGKVNPVMCEMAMQVSAQVLANDLAVCLGDLDGNLDLNVMMPLIGANLIESAEILGRAARVFAEKCVEGLEADREKCLAYAEATLMTATALAPAIGYDKAAELAKKAYAEGRPLREVAKESGLLPPEEVDRLLDLRAMTHPEDGGG
ncbi:MAG: class II fumarate hydratase [Actinomycetota bacterium]|nr:MAG: class II fumarate hydratase [Actinomycetota bacterium]